MKDNKKESNLPHGGALVNCFCEMSELESLKQKINSLPALTVSKRVLCDIEMFAIGAFSPLKGFVCKKDYESIVEKMRLSNGLIWPIPITLQVNKTDYENIKNKKEIVLKDELNEPVAILTLNEIYEPDLKKEAECVFKTSDLNHPAVKYLFEAGKYFLSGDIKVLKNTYDEFPEYNLACKGTREIFIQKGWKRIVAFQTRNPVHRAHEYLLKVALETVDGLMLHPTMGETKGDDIPGNILS